MKNFEKWDRLYRANALSAFNRDKNGILWLKVRAICRTRQISKFLQYNRIILSSKTLSRNNEELFDLLETKENSMELLDAFLQDLSNEWYTMARVDKEKLKEDLYKINSYSWG